MTAIAAVIPLVAEVLRDLWWVEFGWVDEFADDLDDRPLTTACRDPRSGKRSTPLRWFNARITSWKLGSVMISGDPCDCRSEHEAPAVPKSNESIAFWLIARLPLRLPPVTG